ncbi:MAG: DNA photolyase, partial [Rhodobacteraceae bacterium]|nr:DNA photolyase [Paracoccaceae bacterium]
IGAVRDGVARAGADHGIPATMGDGDWAEAIAGAAHAAQVRDVVTGYAPVGPVAERLRDIAPALRAQGLTLHQIRRPYDDLAWPHATRGFFALKKKIPAILRDLNLSA